MHFDFNKLVLPLKFAGSIPQLTGQKGIHLPMHKLTEITGATSRMSFCVTQN